MSSKLNETLERVTTTDGAVKVTGAEVSAVLGVMMAVGDAVRDLGSVPSGELYARVMGTLSLAQYEWVVARLKGAGLVSEENHVLRWVGPEVSR